VTVQPNFKKRLAKEAAPLLTLGTLGTVAVVVLYFFIPGFQPIELVLMLAVVGFGTAGYAQRTVHGIMTIPMLYIATGIAATFYRTIAPYVASIQRVLALDFSPSTSPNVSRGTLAVSFGLLTVVIWVVLEAIGRASFQDTSLPRLGILDNLGGMLVYLVIGVLVASLLFNAVGYGWPRIVRKAALLRPVFSQVLYWHYTAQSFWFPRKSPPGIYVHDLGLLRAR
jgi:hypothetical protein